MSEQLIRRRHGLKESVQIRATVVGSTAVRVDDMSGAIASFGTTDPAVTGFSVWVSDAEGGNYSRLYRSTGNAVNVAMTGSTTEARAYTLPDEVFAAAYIKLVSLNASEFTATLIMKS